MINVWADMSAWFKAQRLEGPLCPSTVVPAPSQVVLWDESGLSAPKPTRDNLVDIAVTCARYRGAHWWARYMFTPDDSSAGLGLGHVGRRIAVETHQRCDANAPDSLVMDTMLALFDRFEFSLAEDVIDGSLD